MGKDRPARELRVLEWRMKRMLAASTTTYDAFIAALLAKEPTP